MREALKIDDRVVLRGFGKCQDDGRAIDVTGKKGQLRQVSDRTCSVKLDGDGNKWVYINERQVRRLVKRKAREFRGYWAEMRHKDHELSTTRMCFVPEDASFGDLKQLEGPLMALREVRAKDKP